MKSHKIVTLMLCLLVISSCNKEEQVEPGVEASLIWERIFTKGVSNGNQAAVHNMVRDTDNNIYVIGEYRGGISFNAEGQDDFSLLLDAEGKDGFVLKLNADGNSIWARTMVTSGSDFFIDGLLRDNKLYIANNESVLWVLDLDGNELTKTGFGSVDDETTDIHFSVDGNLYFTGFERSGFGYYHNSYGKFNSQGEVEWQKEYLLEGNFEQRAKIATSPDGHIYVVGNNSKESIFINKMDAMGDIIWTKSLDAEQALLEQFLITEDGKLFIAGKFVGSKTEGLDLGIDLDPGVGVERFLATSAGFDQFMVLLDADGTFIWGDDLYSKGFNTAFEYVAEVNGELLMTFDTYNGVTSGGFNETEILIEADEKHDGFLRISLIDGTISTYNFNGNFLYLSGVPEAFTLLSDGSMVYANFLRGEEPYQGVLISRQKF